MLEITHFSFTVYDETIARLLGKPIHDVGAVPCLLGPHVFHDPCRGRMNAQMPQRRVARIAEHMGDIGGQGDHVAGAEAGRGGFLTLEPDLHRPLQDKEAFDIGV